mgnify:CR=1 FL=1
MHNFQQPSFFSVPRLDDDAPSILLCPYSPRTFPFFSEPSLSISMCIVNNTNYSPRTPPTVGASTVASSRDGSGGSAVPSRHDCCTSQTIALRSKPAETSEAPVASNAMPLIRSTCPRRMAPHVAFHLLPSSGSSPRVSGATRQNRIVASRDAVARTCLQCCSPRCDQHRRGRRPATSWHHTRRPRRRRRACPYR